MPELLAFVAEQCLPLVFLNGDQFVADVDAFLEEVISGAGTGNDHRGIGE